MFPAGSRVLVMVSGGQDSLALLHVLASGYLEGVAPEHVFALHVNHHLRGEESDADETLVRGACSRLGVELTVLHRPVDKTLGNVQEAARNARRAAAMEIAEALGCGLVAVGHTADDQAETLLYRAARYGGLSALAGMRPNDPPWVRPLLDCRRADTETYCHERGLEFARDSGNAYPGYARTRIRGSVLPAWEKALPGAVEAACRTAEVAAEARALAVEAVSEAMTEVRAGTGGELHCGALLALSAPLRRLLLHEWLGDDDGASASRAEVLAVESLLEVSGSAGRSLSGGRRAVKEYDLIYIDVGGGTPCRVPDPVELPLPGKAQWGCFEIASEHCERFRAVDVGSEAIIDADAVSAPIEVRGPRPGDRIRPLGSAGSRKLKEIFIDRKVPARERPWRPLLVCGERIIWVGGLLIAEEVKVTEWTKRFLRFSMTPTDDGESDCAS